MFAFLLLVAALALPGMSQEVPFTEADLIAADKETVKLIHEKSYEQAVAAADRELVIARALGVEPAVQGTLYNKSCVLALMGRGDEAAEALQAAVDAGYTHYLHILFDSDFAGIRENERFRAVMAGLRKTDGLEPLVFDAEAQRIDFRPELDPPDLAHLMTLRRTYALDDVVAGMETDYERLLRITEWTSSRWQHSSTEMASKADPLTILEEAEKGGRFICRDYAIVLAGAARALGMPARLLGLLPKDVETRSEAHSVAEVWLGEFKKWVLADGQFGIVAEIDGVPLSGLELQAAIAREDPRLRCNRDESCTRWKRFIYPNMYYFKTNHDQRRFERGQPWQMVLVPKGAAWPRKFAGAHEDIFNGAFYTSSAENFYQPPQ